MKRKHKNTKAAQAAHETVQAREDDRGTPETRAKATGNVTAELAARGRLNAAEIAAAAEIERVHGMVGRSHFPNREMDIALRGTGGSVNTPISWRDRMSEAELWIYQNHYIPWTGRMARVRSDDIWGRSAKGNVRYIYVNVVEIVVAIVWDNLRLGETESRFNMKSMTALSILRYGLRKYAGVAGL